MTTVTPRTLGPRRGVRQWRERQWLNRYRLRRAQELLETTDAPVEQIGTMVGFGSATTFRERFKGIVGVSPWAYRRAFRSGPGRPGGAPAARDH